MQEVQWMSSTFRLAHLFYRYKYDVHVWLNCFMLTFNIHVHVYVYDYNISSSIEFMWRGTGWLKFRKSSFFLMDWGSIFSWIRCIYMYYWCIYLRRLS